MRKIVLLNALLISLITFATHSYAEVQGGYIGIGGGYGYLQTPGSKGFVVPTGPGNSNTYRRGGIAGRAFLGIKSGYIGAEGGYTEYPYSKYSATDGAASSAIYYNLSGWDARLKAYLPFGPCRSWDLYGFAGAIRAHGSLKWNSGGIPLSGSFSSANIPNVTSKSYKTLPLAGVGIDWNYYKRLSVNLEYTFIRGIYSFGSNPNAVPSANLVTANLSYNFI